MASNNDLFLMVTLIQMEYGKIKSIKDYQLLIKKEFNLLVSLSRIDSVLYGEESYTTENEFLKYHH